jgi:hypothetical protein
VSSSSGAAAAGIVGATGSAGTRAIGPGSAVGGDAGGTFGVVGRGGRARAGGA